MSYTTIRVSTTVRDQLRRLQAAAADDAGKQPNLSDLVEALADRWQTTEAARRRPSRRQAAAKAAAAAAATESDDAA